jgi:GT2 family glycosyltransferase
MPNQQGSVPEGPSPFSSRVSVVIVTYKSIGFIDRCLAPFTDRPDVDVLLWENASDDGVVEHVRGRYPNVRVIDSTDNLGFARGNNRAFTQCAGRYYLLLNPDAFIEDASVVDQLADHLDTHPDTGAVGPRLLNQNGSHQVGDAGWRIAFGTILAHALMIQRILASVPSLYLTNSRLLRKAEVSVDWVCGACMMVRSDIVRQVGGMDESIFMYGEDVEWGTRIRQAGWLVTYLPRLTVLHLQGASQKGDADLFFSTKWLDDSLTRFAVTAGHLSFAFLKTSLLLGYALRALLFAAAGILRSNRSWRARGAMSWRYARHILSGAPSWASVRALP